MEIDNFHWTDDQINDFRSKIEYFKSFKEKEISNENFYEAYKTCFLLFDKIPLISTKVDVPYVLRGRPNYNGEIFSEEWQISYNERNAHKIPLGRFNRPQIPMFYCTAPNDIPPPHFGLVASLESCKDLFLIDNKIDVQYLTFGKWFLSDQIEVVNLCYNTQYLAANPRFAQAVRKQQQEIRDIFPEQTATFILEFWKFLSDMAANRLEVEQDHFLTTAYLTAFLKYREEFMNSEAYGVMYPSTVTENTGLNIVLTPNAVNKFLTLKSVFMAKFTRDASEVNKSLSEQCTEEAIVRNHSFNLIRRSNF